MINAQSDLNALADRLEASGVPKSYVKMVRDKASVSNIAKSTISGFRKLDPSKMEGILKDPMSHIGDIANQADVVVSQGLRSGFASAAHRAKDTVYGWKSPTAFLNPIGSRVATSAAAALGDSADKATGGWDKMKNTIGGAASKIWKDRDQLMSKFQGLTTTPPAKQG